MVQRVAYVRNADPNWTPDWRLVMAEDAGYGRPYSAWLFLTDCLESVAAYSGED